jgi:hypothetical protein
MWKIGRAPNSIQVYAYIQQDATSHSLFISGNCSTCFGWYFHPSSGEQFPDINKLCNVESCWIYLRWKHLPINVKSPNNTNIIQMGFNSAFKGIIQFNSVGIYQRADLTARVPVIKAVQSHKYNTRTIQQHKKTLNKQNKNKIII